MPQCCGFIVLWWLQYDNTTGLVLRTGLKDFPQRAEYNGEWQAPKYRRTADNEAIPFTVLWRLVPGCWWKCCPASYTRHKVRYISLSLKQGRWWYVTVITQGY